MTGTSLARDSALIGSMTKTDAAYQEIRHRILSGLLAPGSTIGQESLAADLGLSTTPVREALRRLEAAGWVSLAVHREARIAPLSHTELNELYAVRLSLDPMAAELACQAIDAERLERLDELLNEPEPPDLERRLKLNRELHRTIYTACGNQTLIDILDQLSDRSDRYRLVLLSESPVMVTTSHEEHTAIVDAIRMRKKRVVGRLMRDHLLGSLETLRPLLADGADE